MGKAYLFSAACVALSAAFLALPMADRERIEGKTVQPNSVIETRELTALKQSRLFFPSDIPMTEPQPISPLPSVDTFSYDLVGVVLSDTEKVALLKNRLTQTSHILAIGEEVDGYSLIELKDRAATLKKGDDIRILMLSTAPNAELADNNRGASPERF